MPPKLLKSRASRERLEIGDRPSQSALGRGLAAAFTKAFENNFQPTSAGHFGARVSIVVANLDSH